MMVRVFANFRSIIRKEGGFPRPLLDLSHQNFAKLIDRAVGFTLIPPFDPYANSLNYLLATYTIPYVGLVGYVGTIPYLKNMTSRRVRAHLSFPIEKKICVNYYCSCFLTVLINKKSSLDTYISCFEWTVLLLNQYCHVT